MSRKTSDGRYVLQKGEYERKGQRGYIYKWRDAYGIQCSVSAVTLQDLREKEKEVKIGQLEGRIASQQRKTVNDFYFLWREQKKHTTIKENVLSNYCYMYERFVSKSFLGKMAIKNVKKSDVLRLYGELLDKQGLKMNTVDNGVHTVLHQVLQKAVDDDIIRRNPSDACIKDLKGGNKSKKVVTKKPSSLSPEEQARFLEVISGDTTWEPIFGIMIRTGMRAGELTGLQWSDIDEERGFLHVNHTLVYYKDHDSDVMKKRMNSTKTTASDRTLPLNDEIIRLLKIQKENMVPCRISLESDDGACDDLIFTTRFGDNHHQGTLNKALKRIVREANSDVTAVPLPQIHSHMLRKTYCTNLARAGVDLTTAMRLMGHSDIAVTAEIYTEVQDDMKRNADRKLQHLMTLNT